MSTTRKLWLGLGARCWSALASCSGWAARFSARRRRCRQRSSPPAADGLHTRRHRDRPPGLAEHRRPATGLDLGPWCAGRAGLVGRLAASRDDEPARTARPRDDGPGLRRARRPVNRRACWPSAPAVARQHLRRGQRTLVVPDERAQAIAQVAAHYESLFSTTRRPTRCAKATRCARTPCPIERTGARSARSFSGPAGPRSRSARARDELHTELALRAAGRQCADAGYVHVDRVQRRCSCSPASACWPGTTRSGTQGSRGVAPPAQDPLTAPS